MSTAPDPLTQKALFRSRAIFLSILALFLLPALLAFINLKTEAWKSKDLTHHGELIQPPVHIEALQLKRLSINEPLLTTDEQSNTALKPQNLAPQNLTSAELTPPEKLWQILYIVPNDCDQSCLHSQYISQQVRTGMGPEKGRVSTHYIHLQPLKNGSDSLQINGHEIDLSQDGSLNRWQTFNQDLLALQASTTQTNNSNNLEVQNPLAPGFIFLADPLGNIMMKYKISTDFDQALQQAKGLKKDLKKLLKLSRIG